MQLQRVFWPAVQDFALVTIFAAIQELLHDLQCLCLDVFPHLCNFLNDMASSGWLGLYSENYCEVSY